MRFTVFLLSGVSAIMPLCPSSASAGPTPKKPATGTQSVTLEWNPSTNADIVSYNIYYGGASGDYTNVLSVGIATNLTISGLLDGATYYFAATAVDSSDSESAFSNQTSYTVPGTTSTPPPDILSAPLYSGGWYSFYVNGVLGNSYVIQASTNLVNWTSLETNTSPFMFVDTNANQFNQRFYQAVSLPP